MSIKMRILQDSISFAETRLEEINRWLNDDPLSELISVRKAAHEILGQPGTSFDSVHRKISKLAKREKRAMRRFDYQQKNYKRLLDESVKISCELQELKNELFCLEMANQFSRVEQGLYDG